MKEVNIMKVIKNNLVLMVICIVLLCGIFYIISIFTVPVYRNLIGHFVPVSTAKLPAFSKSPITIYKSNDEYLLINNERQEICKAVLSFNKQYGWYFSIIQSNIEKQIGNFKGSIQLKNHKILFYNYEEIDARSNAKTPLDFTIYDIQTNSIDKKIISSFAKSRYSFNCMHPINTDGDFLYSMYNNADKSNIIIRYNSNNNIQELIPNKDNVYICNVVKENIGTDNSNWLIFSKDSATKTFEVNLNQFNPNNNSFQKIETSAINKILNEKKIDDFGRMLFPLNKECFLLFGYSFKTKENIISLFRIDNNIAIEVYTINPKEDPSFKGILGKFGIDTPNVFSLNDKELLLTGGVNGRADLAWPRKEAYIYNIENKKLTRMGDMNFEHYGHSALKIDDKKVLIYEKYNNQVNNIEMFERGRLWSPMKF